MIKFARFCDPVLLNGEQREVEHAAMGLNARTMTATAGGLEIEGGRGRTFVPWSNVRAAHYADPPPTEAESAAPEVPQEGQPKEQPARKKPKPKKEEA